MASTVDVFNLALSHISAKAFVQSLIEESNESKYCSANIDAAIEIVLEDHDWLFASAYEDLALTGVDAESPWIYQYTYPSLCVKAREIVKDSDQEKDVPFKPDLNSSKGGKVIHTDKQDARLRYTHLIKNIALFSPKAVEALSWKLASLIAIPLTGGNLKLKQNTETTYVNVLSAAKTSNFNENVNREAAEPSMISIRG